MYMCAGVFNVSTDEALLLHSKVLGLRKPAANTLKAFKQWFEPLPRRAQLRGYSSHVLDDESDLVALRVPADQDRLTRTVQVYFPWLFLVSPINLEQLSPLTQNRPKHPMAL